MKLKNLFYIAVLSAITGLFVNSCYYDNEEALYPSFESACDTTNVTYSVTIQPILQSNCYACHSDANAAFGGNVHLQSVNDVISNASKIQTAIKRTGQFPMPPAGRLNSCAVQQFDIWIKNGTPAN
jgi:hypothetical protein